MTADEIKSLVDGHLKGNQVSGQVGNIVFLVTDGLPDRSSEPTQGKGWEVVRVKPGDRAREVANFVREALENYEELKSNADMVDWKLESAEKLLDDLVVAKKALRTIIRDPGCMASVRGMAAMAVTQVGSLRKQLRNAGIEENEAARTHDSWDTGYTIAPNPRPFSHPSDSTVDAASEEE